jgi:hypothetical protein
MHPSMITLELSCDGLETILVVLITQFWWDRLGWFGLGWAGLCRVGLGWTVLGSGFGDSSVAQVCKLSHGRAK